MTDGGGGEPEIVVLADAEGVSAAAASEVAGRLRDAVEARGRAHWATTGGSAPVGIYRHLGAEPLTSEVPWASVELWWGDDRYVPRDHPLSNVLPADQVLLAASARAGISGTGEGAVDVDLGLVAGAALPAEQIHAIPMSEAIGESRGPAWAAARYEDELRGSGIEVAEGWPVFDVVLLGIGPDGHLLSVFPGSDAFEARDWVLPVPAPSHVEPHVSRVTLNPAILGVARRVIVVVHGESKAEIIATLLGPERDPRRWPAQLARREGVLWLLDEAAAGRAASSLR